MAALTMDALDYVRSILGGCGSESLLVELMAIIRNLTDEYSRGNVSEQELDGYVAELCKSIMYLASRCNKTISLDTCINELKQKIVADAYAGRSVSLIEAFREKFRKRKATSTATGTLGIIG